MQKLELYGVQNSELAWFKSYLTNHKQFCQNNMVYTQKWGHRSLRTTRLMPVPPSFPHLHQQCPTICPKLHYIMFADDTSLCYQSSDITQLDEAIVILNLIPGCMVINFL